jgi:hypothetical protein
MQEEKIENETKTGGRDLVQGSGTVAAGGLDEIAQFGVEYPEALQGGAAVLPPEVMKLKAGGMSLVDAYRLYDLRRTKQEYVALKAQYDAELANKANAADAVGSVAGGQAYEKDYYTSQEWDKLPQNLKEKFIKNGRIFEFMKKWSGK